MSVRTTVRVDDDVAAAVERRRLDEGLSFSQALNAIARAGLATREPAPGFVQATARVGVVVDVSNVAEALELLDGADHT
jgi:hypothetical protein